MGPEFQSCKHKHTGIENEGLRHFEVCPCSGFEDGLGKQRMREEGKEEKKGLQGN
jgi:hypothetical protein